MHRTRLVLAAAMIGAAGFFTLSWGQAPAPGASPNFASGRVNLTGVGQPFNVYLHNPENAQLDQEISGNIQKLTAETDAAKKTQLEKDIKTALAKQFDDRQSVREEELKNLEERVKQLRELLDKRQKVKDDIIESRFQDLIRDSSGLGWGGDGPSPQGQAFGLFTSPAAGPARVPLYAPPERAR